MRDFSGLDTLDECVQKGKRTVRYRCGKLPLRGILPEDILTVEESGVNAIRPGDLVLGCDAASRTGMFQVIGKRRADCGELLVVRGEYTLYFDDAIAAEDCAGRVISIMRGGKTNDCTSWSRKAKRYASVMLLKAKRLAAAVLRLTQGMPLYTPLARRLVRIEGLSFRMAVEEDIPALCGLFAWHCWPMGRKRLRERMEHFFRVPGRRWFIAVINKRVAGMICADDTAPKDAEKAWFMDMIFVPVHYRRLGIGSRLVHYALAQGIKGGVTEFRGVGTPFRKSQMDTLERDGSIRVDVAPEKTPRAPGRPPRFEYAITVLKPEALNWSGEA